MNPRRLINYLSTHQFDAQHAKVSLFVADLCFKAFTRSNVLKNARVSPLFCHMSFDTFLFYEIIEQNRLYDFSLKTYEEYLRNPDAVKKIFKERKELMDRIGSFFGAQDIRKMPMEELLIFYKTIMGRFEKWWEYGVLGEDKGLVIERKIIPQFAERRRLTIDKARDIISILSHSDRLSAFNLERRDFLALCLAVAEKRPSFQIDKQSDAYIRKYFWFKTDFYEAHEITPKSLLLEVKKELSEKSKKDVEKEIKQIAKGIRKISSQRKRLLKNLSLSAEEKKDLAFIRDFVLWQDERKEQMMMGFFYALSLVREIVRRFGWSYDTVTCSTTDEFSRIIEKKGKFRKRNGEIFIVYERDKKPILFEGDWPRKMLEAVLKIEKGAELKGIVASRTDQKKIVGRARIVIRPTTDTFKKKEILVTSMTRVEFVPLMRKARAIITNEGGISCHAAIVSRELNLPCIIGTKIAAQVIKNGDLVEMDMENGRIRILKK